MRDFLYSLGTGVFLAGVIMIPLLRTLGYAIGSQRVMTFSWRAAWRVAFLGFAIYGITWASEPPPVPGGA